MTTSSMTPAEFYAEVKRVIASYEDDDTLIARVLVSLVEDTLCEFGYEDGIELIAEWRKELET